MKIFVRLWWQEAAGFTSCNLRGPHSLLFEFMIICERVDFWNVMPGSQPNISAIKRTRCSFTFVWKRRKNTFKIWLSPFFAQINLNWFSWGKKPWSFGQKQYTIHKNNEIIRLLVELLGCDPAMVFQKSSLSLVLMNLKIKNFVKGLIFERSCQDHNQISLPSSVHFVV